MSDYLHTAIEAAAAFEAAPQAAVPAALAERYTPVDPRVLRRAMRRYERRRDRGRGEAGGPVRAGGGVAIASPGSPGGGGPGLVAAPGGGDPRRIAAQYEHQSEAPTTSLYLQTAIEDAAGVELPPFSLAADAPAAAPIEDHRSDPTGSACATGPQAGAKALATELQARFGGRAEIFACRPVRGAKRLSLHGEGRAVDWFRNVNDPAEAAEAQRILDWLLASDAAGNQHALARRMGVQEIIFDRRIWTARRHAEGWRAYGGVNPHTDHIHIGLNRPGARMQTSHWTRGTAAAQSATPVGALDADEVRRALRAGRHRNAKVTWGTGAMPFVSFADDGLEALRKDLQTRWLPSGPAAPKTGAAPGGDSQGTPVAAHPDWVNRFVDRLVVQDPRQRPGDFVPKKDLLKNRWNDDSAAAQHLIEAYMRAWHRREISPQFIPINVQELYARIGASTQNREADILGGWGLGNWCGIASERAMGLALMRRGLRLKTGKPVRKPKPEQPPADPAKRKKWQIDAAQVFSQEVSLQGSHWILTQGWAKKSRFFEPHGKDFERRVNRPACYCTPLKAGDYFYLQTYPGPVSGHVALVIRETPRLDPASWPQQPPGTALSDLIIISGNSKGRAVRQEVVVRERSPWSMTSPPKRDELDWLGPAGVGNDYDAAVAARDKALKAVLKPVDAAAGKLAAWATKTKMAALPNLNLKPNKDGTRPKLPAAAFPVYFKTSPGEIQKHFAAAPDLGEYMAAWNAYKAASAPAETAFAAAVAALKKRAVEFQNMPLTRGDPTWDSRNLVPANSGNPRSGRWSPSVPDRIWVVALLRGSRFANLDNEIARARSAGEALTSVADKHDLDVMPASIQAVYGDALDHWSTASSFPSR